jgi:ABC-type phosphate transport system auxiliary subunit
MSTKPPNMENAADPSDAYIRTLAGIELSLENIAKEVASVKGELRRIIPRIDTLAAEVKENSRLVHRQAAVIESVTNESLGLNQSRIAIEKAVEDMRTENAARGLQLERAVAALERDNEFQAERLRRLRDDVADHVAEAGEEGPSGVMNKPRM